MKSSRSKGFTLAELLIVVAIIAVLVAVSIPVFTGQLEKARNATDEANGRSIDHCLKVYYLTRYGEDDNINMSEHFGRVDGYVFVNQDQIRCSGEVYKALVASGYGKKSDWRHPAGHDEYVSEIMTCQSKTKWKAFQITFTIKDGEIEFTYCSRVNGKYGDAFAKAIGGTYKEINMGDEEGKF